MPFDRDENQRQHENAKDVLERAAGGEQYDTVELLAHAFLMIDARLESIEETHRETQREVCEALAIIGGEV